MHESTRVILEYNAGRDPERLTRKLAAIAADRYPGSVLRMILISNTQRLSDRACECVCDNNPYKPTPRKSLAINRPLASPFINRMLASP